MLDTLLQQVKYLDRHVIWELVFMIVLASYFLKVHMDKVLPKWDLTYKVLLLSVILSIFYWFINPDSHPYKLIMSYTFATSFYQVFWKYFIKLVSKAERKIKEDNYDKENN